MIHQIGHEVHLYVCMDFQDSLQKEDKRSKVNGIIKTEKDTGLFKRNYFVLIIL